MPLRNLKMQYFMHTFKTLMQTGKASVAKGWTIGVEISVFSLGKKTHGKKEEKKSKKCIFISW